MLNKENKKNEKESNAEYPVPLFVLGYLFIF